MKSVQADKPAMQSLEHTYRLEEDELRRNTPKEVKDALAKFGIGFGYVEFVSAVPSALREEDAIYTNWFDPRNGVVIANLNDKTKDFSAEEDKIFPSEILWQSWCRVASRNSVPFSNLRTIVRYFIANEASQRIIKDVLDHSFSSRDVEDHLGYTELDDGFFAILGSVNGASSMRMLLDHRQALRFRTAERVVLLKQKKRTYPIFIILLSSPRDVEIPC